MTRRWLTLLLLAVLSGDPGQQTHKIEVTKEIALQAPAGWQVIPKRFKNAVEIVTPPVTPARPVPTARIVVTTEERQSHEEAVNRLLQIAAGYDAPPAFLEIGGWPAIQRRMLAPIPRIEARVEQQRAPENPKKLAWRVTTAIAANNTLIRSDVQFARDANMALVTESEAIGRSFVFATRGEPAIVRREIEQLAQAWPTLRKPQPPKNPPAALTDIKPPKEIAGKPIGLTRPGDPLLGPGSEISIATSADGQNGVVATNSGFFASNDSGATFSPLNAIPLPFPNAGDPSVASGVSGNFYISYLGFPPGPPSAGGPAGCAASMSTSTNGGRSFAFTSNPAFCSLAGTGPGGMCSPDQPQIVADRVNAAAGSDQIYEAWRNFTQVCPLGIGCPSTCSSFGGGSETPMLACSSNSGTTWTAPIVIGGGDRPRLAVGPDGFLYTVLRDGSNVMLYKYSSCSAGFSLVSGFPVLVDSINDPACPVPGLDRCVGDALSNATVAVDETNPAHVYVAYSENTASGNDDIIVRQSLGGGLIWGGKTTVNTPVTARRFMPWVTTAGGGTAFVSWYDRRAATTTANDLTDFFLGGVRGMSGIILPEQKLSSSSDPQCASGWTFGSDNDNDSTSCSTQPQIAGHCFAWLSGVDFTPGAGPTCDIASNNPCTGTSRCHNFGIGGVFGGPKYGDYNGIASAGNVVFTAWASNVVPGPSAFASAVILKPPTVASVTPNGTACATTTTVTIRGANFYQVQDVGLFQKLTEVSKLGFNVDSDTQITATIPNSVGGGIYEIIVTTPQGSSMIGFNQPHPDQFSVAPTVTSISPTSGPAAGGTEVTVSGACMGNTLFFGSSQAVVWYGAPCNSTRCVVHTPAASVAVVDVVDDVDGVRSPTTPRDQFTYTPPIITSVSPSSGPTTGGTQVAITGTGFPPYDGTNRPNVQMSFGPAQAMAQCSVTDCKVITPFLAQTGPVHIIANAFGVSSTPSPADLFTYNLYPKLIKFQLPDAFYGIPSAVFLDGNAPGPSGATVDLTSSDSSVVSMQSPVNIPARSQSAIVPLTFLPTTKTENVTLTAKYEGSEVNATVSVSGWPALSIVPDTGLLAGGDSATLTLTINAFAPPGGALISLSSSDPSAIPVASASPVKIPTGAYQTTTTITNNFGGRPLKQVTITAMYGSASASTTLTVGSVPIPPRCRPHRCPKGTYWNPDTCGCESPQ